MVLRGEVGAGRRRVPTVATSLPRSEPRRRLRVARWQRSVSQKTTPTWVDSHGVAWTPSPLRARWQSRRRSLQDPQRSSYLSFGLLLFRCVLSTDFGTSMPSMSAEESIPSLDGGSTLAVDPVVSKSLLRRAALDRIQELLHQLDRKWEYERRVLFGCDLGKSL